MNPILTPKTPKRPKPKRPRRPPKPPKGRLHDDTLKREALTVADPLVRKWLGAMAKGKFARG